MSTARRQSVGEGQHGSQWLSPQGSVSASLAFVARPETLPVLPLIFAFYVKQIVESYLQKASILGTNENSQIQLKFKNDVFLKGKKLAGVLVESLSEGSGSSVAIVGVGLNVANTFSGELGIADSFISLRDAYDCHVEVEDFEHFFVVELRNRIQNLTEIWNQPLQSDLIQKINDSLIYVNSNTIVTRKTGAGGSHF